MSETRKIKVYGRVYTFFLSHGARISISDYEISVSPEGRISVEYRLYGRGDGYTSSFSLTIPLPDGGETLLSFLKEKNDIVKGIIESVRQRRRLATLAKLLYLVTVSIYGLKITRALKAISYYHEENEVYYQVPLSVNAFIKGIYRERQYFTVLLESLGLSWPRA